MFQGTVPNQALKLLATVIKEWDCDRIFVGCSGNFTVERAISKIIDCPIVSNDVVSMKYRGLFEQYGRRVIEEDDNGKPLKYNLSYGASAGQWTLREGYEVWKQKFYK